MKLADRIAALEAPERSRVDMVDFWGDDSVIYASPLTARDITKVSRKHKGFQTNPTLEAMVDLLILKAEDESGDKAFTLEHKVMLMGRPLPELTHALGIVEGVDVEDIEKN